MRVAMMALRRRALEGTAMVVNPAGLLAGPVVVRAAWHERR